MKKRGGGVNLYILIILTICMIVLLWILLNHIGSWNGGCKSCGSKCGKGCKCGKGNCSMCQKRGMGGKEGMAIGHWTDQIDMIYYINLDKRADRREEFLSEMKRMGVPETKIKRVSAVYKPNQGDWGCTLSHIHTLKEIQQSGYKNCLVCEDDFQFTVDSVVKMNEIFQSFADQNVNYDVIMFSGNEIDVKPCEIKGLKRVYSAQTTSGYMVSSSFIPKLMENYIEAAKLIERSYEEQGKGEQIQQPYCIDQYWKKLQPTSKWYMFYPKLGKQRNSVSDIQGGYVEMTV